MSSDIPIHSNPPLDLSKWRNVPVMLMVVGAILAAIGVLAMRRITPAIRVFLAAGVHVFPEPLPRRLVPGRWCIICLTPVGRCRRGAFCEHLACLLAPPMLLLFLPIAILAPHIYPWMQ